MEAELSDKDVLAILSSMELEAKQQAMQHRARLQMRRVVEHYIKAKAFMDNLAKNSSDIEARVKGLQEAWDQRSQTYQDAFDKKRAGLDERILQLEATVSDMNAKAQETRRNYEEAVKQGQERISRMGTDERTASERLAKTKSDFANFAKEHRIQ